MTLKYCKLYSLIYDSDGKIWIFEFSLGVCSMELRSLVSNRRQVLLGGIRLGGSTTGGSSSSAARGVKEGEAALEEMEMEMQPCHGTHHHLLEHSDDHHGMEVGPGWETCEYKNDWE